MKSFLSASVMLLLLFAATAFAFEVQGNKTNLGFPAVWPENRLTLTVSRSLLDDHLNLKTDDDVLGIVQKAVGRWQSVCAVDISIVVSDDESVSPRGEKGDGISLLTIAPTSQNLLLFSGENSDLPAITRLFVDRIGRITEADIVLNPVFLISSNGIPGSYDLESTLVHEIGHAIGLGHSKVAAASMNENVGRNGLFGMPFTQFRTLASDDVTKARDLYGPRDPDQTCCGTLTGEILKSDSDAKLIVWIESAESGKVIAASEVGRNGEFAIGGLAEDLYRIYVKSERLGGIGELTTAPVFLRSGTRMSVAGEFRSTGEKSELLAAGFNGQIAGISVPLSAGNSYMLFLLSEARTGDDLDFGFTSPELSFEEGYVERFDYGRGRTALSVIVDAGKSLATGEYSVWARRNGVPIAVIVGAVSMEDGENPWVFRRLD